MKKIIVFIFISTIIVSCKTSLEKQNKVITNNQIDQTKDESLEKITIKTKEFEIDLPKGFNIVEKDGIFLVVKTSFVGKDQEYFSIKKFSKEERKEAEKCNEFNKKAPKTIEDIEKMSKNQKELHIKCSGPIIITNPEELAIIHITEDDDFWILDAGHEIPVSEENYKTYAKTLEKFDVKEKMADSSRSIISISKELVDYFKKHSRFK